ncbi:protein STRUBBELIG-RECEPTOR FAMILY 2-like isoform X2 [Benincasa hispida]|uniref:protein STRUBBELIG-RECEPTOR FAMILY 2-like isoform X2 n=1 Tax=Benincasa hispida TaxID=102211 RepID=UPI001900A2AD|nr:protein STRUBBELIG-RECEPTOR FAMILY 2-like isoform X2 [Benincasa hispida]
MAHLRPLLYFSVLVFFAIMTSVVQCFTDPLDVIALLNLYSTLNYPPELIGWRTDGGDPCDGTWTGVFCVGSSVINLKLNRLNLSGNLGDQLYLLHNLKQLDASSNTILGEIPSGLPPNVTYMNLSHNVLSGPLGNAFSGLQNLVEMDLSYNDFTGDLSSSFASLTNLNRLFLQKNKFTGSVSCLSDLPLTDLNIQDNYFSGTIPEHFKTIPNLWIGGNRFDVSNSPPWDFSVETTPLTENNSSPPLTEPIIIKKCPYKKKVGKGEERLGPGGIAMVASGGGFAIIFAALFIAICKTQICAKQRSMKHVDVSLPVSKAEDGSPHILPLSSPVTDGGLNHACPTRHARTEGVYSRSFSKRSRFPEKTKTYTVAELESATNKYSEENLLGEGSLGSVYKAEFPDGQILAVKRVDMAALSFTEEQQFLDVVCTVSRLRHPNIVSLLGYSVENGQHLLAYEYVRNLSLDDALHSVAHNPVSWSVRIQIAHGVAKALDYLHNAFSPPFAHCNLKAANIMLDEEFMPKICDCGLSVLKPLAAQIAFADTGYFAPEYGQSGIDYTKNDVYAFGVLFLELITGKKPNDLRPGVKQSLSRWASFQLHDCGSLDEIIDPDIIGTLSSKVLSRCADIITLCIQPVMERRPPMFAIVGYLASIQRRVEMEKRAAAEGKVVDTFEKSFHTTNTGFISSPTYSCSSI